DFFLSVFLITIGLCVSSPQGRASESPVPTVGISTVSEDKAIPTGDTQKEPWWRRALSTFTGRDSKPQSSEARDEALVPSKDKDLSVVAPVVPIQSGSDSVPTVEPVAVRKDAPDAKIEIMDKKEKKKQSKREKAQDKARAKALEKAVEEQVGAMRDARAREMPYLDKVYIRTSITPFKMQQKEEFLSGGAKDLQDLIIRAQSVNTQSKAAHESTGSNTIRPSPISCSIFPALILNTSEPCKPRMNIERRWKK
ncbi:MAG: hypothetical protein HY767_01835, partial [Candidatus Omnitrophica bacterium]|nr:hypothetical protein [Candidatus Omnitrophota bacterium]